MAMSTKRTAADAVSTANEMYLKNEQKAWESLNTKCQAASAQLMRCTELLSTRGVGTLDLDIPGGDNGDDNDTGQSHKSKKPKTKGKRSAAASSIEIPTGNFSRSLLLQNENQLKETMKLCIQLSRETELRRNLLEDACNYSKDYARDTALYQGSKITNDEVQHGRTATENDLNPTPIPNQTAAPLTSIQHVAPPRSIVSVYSDKVTLHSRPLAASEFQANAHYAKLVRAFQSMKDPDEIQMTSDSLPMKTCPITNGPLKDVVENTECLHYYSREGVLLHIKNFNKVERIHDGLKAPCVWPGCRKFVTPKSLRAAETVMRELRLREKMQQQREKHGNDGDGDDDLGSERSAKGEDEEIVL